MLRKNLKELAKSGTAESNFALEPSINLVITRLLATCWPAVQKKPPFALTTPIVLVSYKQKISPQSTPRIHYNINRLFPISSIGFLRKRECPTWTHQNTCGSVGSLINLLKWAFPGLHNQGNLAPAVRWKVLLSMEKMRDNDKKNLLFFSKSAPSMMAHDWKRKPIT